MDERREPYIEQLGEDEALYPKLQARMLDEVQRLSGKVWTDYNVHDPGVTVGDIANHALAELDYKLDFPTADYCIEQGGTFRPERLGLFPPEEAYTTHPVTVEDYRRLFLSHIPELENVRMECDPTTGGYTIRVTLSPFGVDNEKAVCERVKELYHRHRNLCEFLSGEVEIMQQKELEFHAGLEIEAGEGSSLVLARIYCTIQDYLSDAVRLSVPRQAEGSDLTPEEWLEGQTDVLRMEEIPRQHTEHELYKLLCKVKGVRSFSTCYLKKTGEEIPEGFEVQTDFSEGFSLHLPETEGELHVRIRQGKLDDVKPDFSTFRTRLEVLYQTGRHRGNLQEETAGKYHWALPEAVYRDIFTHDSIIGDFPACYRLTEKEKPGESTFESYLRLYDRVMEKGLSEVRELPRILSLDAGDAGILNNRPVRALKKQYLDFLDKLYGVESHPAWLSEENNYGETEEGTLRRRMAFLLHVARLLGNRSRARNLLLRGGEGSTPVIKEWFCRLLGLEHSDEYIAGNALHKHNLHLLERKGERSLRQRIDSMLIDERMQEDDKVEKVPYVELSADEEEKQKEYERLRHELAYFNVNRISGDLFRGGTDLENYRTVQLDRHDYILLYCNKEQEPMEPEQILRQKSWTNLGHAQTREQLNMLANILRRFLRELNRACETLYIVEPVLADVDRPFQLLVVLPGWSARFHSPNFRKNCEELLRSLLPVHLTFKMYWLNERDMADFERWYHQWICSLTDRRIGDYKKLLLEAMENTLFPKKKKEINDSD